MVMRRLKDRSMRVGRHDRGWLMLSAVWPLAMFLPFILRNSPLASGDYLKQYYLWETFFVNAAANGSWPWWNPYIFSGTPWFANPQSATLFPFHWLALPFASGQVPFGVFQSIVALIIAWGGVGVFVLVRRLVRSSATAWWASALWTTSSFFVSHLVDSVTATSVIMCLPWGLWAVQGWVTRRQYRWLVGLMVHTTLAWLAGFPSMFVAYCGAIWLAWILIAWAGQTLRRDWWVMVLVFVGSIGLAGVQLFSAIEVFLASERLSVTHQAVNAPLTLPALMKGLLIFESGAPYWFLGLIPALFVVVTMLARQSVRSARWVIIWTAVTFGAYLGLRWSAPILEQYPSIYNLVRYADRWLVLPLLGLVILAAFGLSDLRQSLNLSPRRTIGLSIAGAVGFFFVLIFGQPIDIISSGVVGAALTIAIGLRRTISRDPRLIAVLFGASLITSTVVLWSRPSSSDYQHIIRASRNWPMVSREYSGGGWDSLVLQQYVAINPDANRQSLPVVADRDGTLAWFPQDIATVPAASINSIVAAHQTSLLERSYRSSADRGPVSVGRVKTIETRPNTFVFTTSNQANGTLVFSQNYYPGWAATIDGQPTPIHRMNGFMQAVTVPAGTHHVRFSFKPRLLGPGLAATVMSAVIIFSCGFYIRTRKRFDHPDRPGEAPPLQE